ncbi:MAG TPA: DUF2628 domain-containing protein [Geminicoccaceae bacterium]|nr:DUF2628 domain-containing protein [Geminicoccaceae bacterium]
MASTRGEVEPFAVILGRRLQAARGVTQGAAPERAEGAQPATDAATSADAAPRAEPEPSTAPAAPASEAPPDDGRPYARLRALTEAAAASGTRLWGGVDDTSTAVLPLDFAKTFVGANATHYDESWRLMEWRDRNHSWNWAAALTFGGWLAYRRLYGYAALHVVWLGLLLLLAVNGVPLLPLASLQLAVVLLLGVYGNALYRRSFRKAATAAAEREGEHPARLALLRAAGGVDVRAPWIMAGAVVVLGALIVRYGHAVAEIPLPL